MAFTRFKYDKSRVDKQLTEETFTARYMLNTPGNGTAMPFQEDPHTRLQMWGANFAGNAKTTASRLTVNKRLATLSNIKPKKALTSPGAAH